MNKDQEQFNNVIDLDATRALRDKTGQVIPIKLDTTPTTASEEAHMDTVIRE